MSRDRPVNWTSDRDYGDKRQCDFLAKHPGLKGIPGELRKHDIEMPDGVRLELKSDRRSYKDTGNCFMETEQDNRDGKPRVQKGIYAARDNGCKYFVYFFSDGMEFWFNVGRLIPLVEAYAARNSDDEKTVPNEWYDTLGYAVPLVQLGSAMVLSPMEVT